MMCLARFYARAFVLTHSNASRRAQNACTPMQIRQLGQRNVDWRDALTIPNHEVCPMHKVSLCIYSFSQHLWGDSHLFRCFSRAGAGHTHKGGWRWVEEPAFLLHALQDCHARLLNYTQKARPDGKQRKLSNATAALYFLLDRFASYVPVWIFLNVWL